MNRSPGSPDIIDPQNSATYRSAATEHVPPELDKAVLDAAGSSVRADDNYRWRDAWYRPLSLAATVLLCLALILQLNDSRISDTVNLVPPGGVSTESTSAFEDAGRVTEEQIRQLESDAGQLPSRSPMTPPPESARTLNNSDTGSLLPADQQCSNEQRAGTTSWWRCVQDLEKRGLTQAAERELQALMRAFPGFTLPD